MIDSDKEDRDDKVN